MSGSNSEQSSSSKKICLTDISRDLEKEIAKEANKDDEAEV